MGFFGKLKQGLGIGTIKLQLQVPGQIAKSASPINGQVTLNAESDQHVNSIKFTFVETVTSGRDADKKTTDFERGILEMRNPFDIKKGETRAIPFSLPFQIPASGTQALADKGGVLGAIGMAASLLASENSEYHVKVVVDCAGAAFDPSDSQRIIVV